MANIFHYEEPTSPEDLALFYRRLEPYLHPRSTSSSDQNKTKTVAILGDSFLIEKRFIADMGETPFKHIPMLPHATEGAYPESGNLYRCARIENLSKGGGTMKMMLKDESAMRKWIEEVPALTIMHLGGCDISNGEINGNKPKIDYKNKVEHFMRTWLRVASEKIKKHIYENVAIKERMENRLKDHKWLIVAIPDWGKENTQIRGVTPEVHKVRRRMCNDALKNCSTYFWNEYKAVVFNTGFLRIDRDPDQIHCSTRDQRRYNEIIFGVARKLICDICKWEISQGKKHLQRDRNICKAGRWGNIPKDQLKKVELHRSQ